jgi:hypothetical protein
MFDARLYAVVELVRFWLRSFVLKGCLRLARVFQVFGATGSSRPNAEVGHLDFPSAKQHSQRLWRHLAFKGYQREKSQKIAL